jgi:hypothetical protein
LYDECLLRRIPHPAETTPDPKSETGLRPRSSAFDPNRDSTPMSVQRLRILQEKGLDPRELMLKEYPEWGIVCFKARQIREFGKGVRPDVTDEDGPAHAIIEDLTDGHKKQLARKAVWFIIPRAHSHSPGPASSDRR